MHANPYQSANYPLARNSDPDTSHLAADHARTFAHGHCIILLEALLQYGPCGKTRLADITGLTDVAVARRLPELQRADLAEPTSERVASGTGHLERVWRAR